MSKRVVSAPAVVAWLLSVLMFGFLHFAANRWLLDNPDGSVRSSLGTAAMWTFFFGLVTWWSQRRGSKASNR